jgi:DNA-binding MarR family transcriptional regulator
MADTDWTDRHVARWRDHWIDIPFDDDVEGVVVRIGRLQRYLKGTMQQALTEVGLQDFEYATLHSLMIRDTPGTASPTDLADELGVSGAGMTGRLDKLQQAGWVQRTVAPDDRRRVVVEITKSGAEIWRRAMAIRGSQEEAMVSVLSDKEQATLNRLLKKMTLHVEAQGSETPSGKSAKA